MTGVELRLHAARLVATLVALVFGLPHLGLTVGSVGADGDPTTYYVSAEVGDDGSDGQSAERPWRSLQMALDRLGPGDTLNVMNGRYAEQTERTVAHYVMRNDGTAARWITVQAAPGHRPLLAPTSGNALSVRADYVEVRGFTIRGEGYGVDNAYGWGVVVRGAHHVRLAENTVSDMPVGGLTAIDSSNIEIIDNVVFDNSFWGTEQGSGISVWHSVDHGFGPDGDGYHDRIVGNIAYRNENKVYSRWAPGQGVISDGNGIIIDESKDTGYTGRTLVANNIAFDNGGRGVLVTKSSRVDVVANTTFRNGRTSILQSGPVELAASKSDDVNFYNNLAWASPGVPAIKITWVNGFDVGGNVFVTDTTSGVETDRDLVTRADPGLIAPSIDPTVANFGPRSDSIVLGRGIETSPPLRTDAEGRARPRVGSDAGAYEASPGVSQPPVSQPPVTQPPVTQPPTTAPPAPTHPPADGDDEQEGQTPVSTPSVPTSSPRNRPTGDGPTGPDGGDQARSPRSTIAPLVPEFGPVAPTKPSAPKARTPSGSLTESPTGSSTVAPTASPTASPTPTQSAPPVAAGPPEADAVQALVTRPDLAPLAAASLQELATRIARADGGTLVFAEPGTTPLQWTVVSPPSQSGLEPQAPVEAEAEADTQAPDLAAPAIDHAVTATTRGPDPAGSVLVAMIGLVALGLAVRAQMVAAPAPARRRVHSRIRRS